MENRQHPIEPAQGKIYIELITYPLLFRGQRLPSILGRIAGMRFVKGWLGAARKWNFVRFPLRLGAERSRDEVRPSFLLEANFSPSA